MVLYGCETWFLTLREEHRLRVFENSVLRRIFGPKQDGVMGGWRTLHNKDLQDLYALPSIIRVIKLSNMRWAGHWWARHRWVDNIKMDLGEIGWGGVD
jgi:hypothetical protein